MRVPRVAIVNRQCEARELEPQIRLAKEKEGGVCRFNCVGTISCDQDFVYDQTAVCRRFDLAH